MRKAVAAAAIALLFGVAAFESGTAIAGDDFGYLMWGLLERGNPYAWVEGPGWFTYRRPLNALVWWLSAQFGIDGELARWAQVGLWTTLGAALFLAARGSARAVVTVLLCLLTNQVFVDLLQWRSWLTTTGAITFLVLAALAIERRASPLFVALLGAAALGFKEVGAVAVAALAVATPGYRWVGAVLFGALAVGSASSAHKLGLGFVLENLRYHVDTLALFVAAVPALVAARFPKVPAWALLLTTLLLVLPGPVRALAFVLSAASFLAAEPRWMVACACAFGLPLVGATHARQYLLEGWIALLVALSMGRPVVPPAAWIAMLVLAAPSAVDFERNRAKLRAEFASQEAFLGDFHPSAARHLYHPDPMWAWNLDALYWIRGGATLEGAPPPDTEPVQVGPLSGVWADARPIQGSGSR